VSFVGAKISDSYVYLNFDPADDWKMRESAQAAAEKIIEVIEAHVNKVCWSLL
jgi:hypothetical protein